MKVLVAFAYPDGTYPEVGMNRLFILEDKRIRHLSTLEKRVEHLVLTYHPSRVGVPYRIKCWESDKVLGYSMVDKEAVA